MKDRQLWVIVYDIADDRRRGRLHTALLGFGTPVQFSVFECWVTAEEFAQLQKRVQKVIRPRKDHVRYYFLCNSCAQRASATGSHELTAPKEVIVV